MSNEHVNSLIEVWEVAVDQYLKKIESQPISPNHKEIMMEIADLIKIMGEQLKEVNKIL